MKIKEEEISFNNSNNNDKNNNDETMTNGVVTKATASVENNGCWLSFVSLQYKSETTEICSYDTNDNNDDNPAEEEDVLVCNTIYSCHYYGPCLTQRK